MAADDYAGAVEDVVDRADRGHRALGEHDPPQRYAPQQPQRFAPVELGKPPLPRGHRLAASLPRASAALAGAPPLQFRYLQRNPCPPEPKPARDQGPEPALPPAGLRSAR